jgi:uncharacterized protein
MPDTLLDYATLCLAAVAGGAVNSVAGGGTLLTFPTLFAVLGSGAGVVANATSTVALFPGSLAATWGYRRELSDARAWFVLLAAPSLLGGLIGSLLLVRLPDSSFKALVPWLILAAAVLFAAQPTIARWTGIGKEHAPPTSWKAAGVVAFQFLVAVYGGYFGAGIGILMLSALAMMGLSDIHRMNGLKTLLASAINGVSFVVFIASGKVDWRYAPAMIISAIAGGYLGARVARRLDRNLVRRAVVVIGFALAAWYFYKQFVATA